jgi:hypothetical protein
MTPCESSASEGMRPETLVLASSAGSPTLELDRPDRVTEMSRAVLTLGHEARLVTDVEIGEPWRGELIELFHGMATDWRGWAEERTWRAENMALELACSHDGIRQVRMQVILRRLFGQPTDWTVEACILVEPGSLSRVAADVEAVMHA